MQRRTVTKPHQGNITFYCILLTLSCFQLIFQSFFFFSKYTAQLKSCEVRYVILKKELEEVALDQQQAVKRKGKIKAGTQMCFCFWYVNGANCLIELYTNILFLQLQGSFTSLFIFNICSLGSPDTRAIQD